MLCFGHTGIKELGFAVLNPTYGQQVGAISESRLVGNRKGFLSGFTIALIIHSLDPSYLQG